MTARLAAITRFPIKGLSGESLDTVRLISGEHMPGDRRFAIENGPSGFDPRKPEHQEKSKFLVLARQAALARLQTRFDDATSGLSIAEDGVEVLNERLDTASGRSAVAGFFRMFLDGALAGEPRVLEAPPGFRFMDSRSGFVSIVNLATVRALEKETGASLDPVRFRANLLVDGVPAFSEFDWIDRKIAIGEVVLRGLKRTERCAATTVNPRTAMRDHMIPAILMRTYGHADCGIYASVAQGGRLRCGDLLAIADEDRCGLPFA